MINDIFTISHNPHYVHRYLRFVHSIKDKGPRTTLFTENHHILPAALFPEFENLKKNSWNLVKLTYREHFIAHLILTKCFTGVNKAKMIHGFNMMLCSKTNKQKRSSLKNSVYYEQKRVEWFSKYGRGINHPNKGRKLSDEHRRKISEAAKKRVGDLNPNFGKKHTFSNESRSRMSVAHKGNTHSDETKLKIAISNTGKVFSKERRENISKAKKAKKIAAENCS